MAQTLTIDDDRPCDERVYRTRDGLRVHAVVEWDNAPEASYGGSLVAMLEHECPGVMEGVTEPYELPADRQRVHSMWPPRPTLEKHVALKLLDGKQFRRLPRFRLARMLSAMELRSDAQQRYVRQATFSLLVLRIRITRGGRLVACYSHSGHYRLSDSHVHSLIKEAVAEARDLLKGEV